MNTVRIIWPILCILHVFMIPRSTAQEINFTIHSRVDTTHPETRKIVNLWTGYLGSKPDSIYDNPFWNDQEKQLYEQFDLTARFIYPLPAQQLLQYYKPTILSVEKEGNYYAIRTLFYADGLQGKYRRSNPWCITKLYAVQEDGKWKLINALPVITKDWHETRVGKIRYIYPPDHDFDSSLALRSNEYCDSIVREFRFPEWEPFDFYITHSGDDLGKLLGFEFFFAGYTTGVGLHDRHTLLSGLGSEWYPHEFIHLVLPAGNRHGLIEEGFATWLGGANGIPFEVLAANLAKELRLNDTITFSDILNRKWGWQHHAYYTTGAIICKKVYDQNGLQSLDELLNTPPENEALMDVLSRLFGIRGKELNSLIRKAILKYDEDTQSD